jgi:hypothetical protein
MRQDGQDWQDTKELAANGWRKTGRKQLFIIMSNLDIGIRHNEMTGSAFEMQSGRVNPGDVVNYSFWVIMIDHTA